MRILNLPRDKDEKDASGDDVDCAVDGLDLGWPLRLPEPWQVVQHFHYDITGHQWAIDDGHAVTYIDALDDPAGIGKYAFPTAGDGFGPGRVAAYLTAKRVLKGSSDASEWHSVHSLAIEDPEAYRRSLFPVFGNQTTDSIATACLRNEIPDAALRRRARRAQQRTRWRSFARSLSVVRLSGQRTIERVARPSGLIVVVAGPDGTGKTTLANDLEERVSPLFRATIRLHWRPNVLPAPGAVLGRSAGDTARPHARSPHGRALSAALLLYYLLDYVVGTMTVLRPARARGRLVIIERGWWDMAVDPRRYRLNVPVQLVQLLGRLVGSPDVHLQLEASPDVLGERKGELTRAEAERQLTAWRNLSHQVKAHVLDAASAGTKVADAGTHVVKQHMEARTIGHAAAGWMTIGRRDSPRWWLPRGPAAVARGALHIYQPMTSRAFFAWRAARLVTPVGVTRAAPRSPAPPRHVRAAIASYLGEGERFAVGRGNRLGRFTALTLSPQGEPRFFAKIATDDVARAALAREVRNIESLPALLAPPLRGPILVDATENLVVFKAERWSARPRPWLLPADIAGALGKTAGLTHGDFAPWNLMATDRGWVVIDWEEARAEHSLFEDLMHYVVQAHSLLGRPTTQEIVEGLDGEGWIGTAMVSYAASAGVDAQRARVALTDYLRSTSWELRFDEPRQEAAHAARRALLATLES